MEDEDAINQGRVPNRRRSRVVKPASWPSYMVERRLKSGPVAYYWCPPKVYTTRGFTLHTDALGRDYATACLRAGELNAHLDDWRRGRSAQKDLDLQPGFGTLEWLVERYYRSRAFEKVSARSRPDYLRELKLITSLTLRTGGLAGTLPLASISARAADRIYDRLLIGPRGRRVRQANVCITRIGRAWDTVQRLYPSVVPSVNPFRGVIREGGAKRKPSATREEAVALHRALVNFGHPHLAAVPLICFELLQRPENVIGGHLTWADYRPPERPGHMRINHHKTGELVWHRLEDEDGPLYPETDAYLATLPRLGVPIVLSLHRKGAKKGIAAPYDFFKARAIVRKARRAAGLAEHVTLDACRHGGMTELGDAGLTESEEMATSGHTTPEAKRRYVKRTEEQRLAAARKRRAWVSGGHGRTDVAQDSKRTEKIDSK